MESFLRIAEIILLISLSVLAVYLVVVLMKVKEILGTVETNVKEVSARAIPVLENMEAITSKLRSITENIDDQMSIVRNSVQSLREITDNIVSFERRVQHTIEGPVLEVAGTLGSIIRGIASFIGRFRG